MSRLRELTGEYLGLAEQLRAGGGAAPAARMEEKPERPHTHDLMLSMIEMLGATLERIEITDLKDGTFYGQVVLKRAGVEFDLDSRPSDALALAARADCPVLIARKVMEQHSYTDDELSGEGFEA